MRSSRKLVRVVAVGLLSVLCLAGWARAQTMQDVVGTWSLVSVVQQGTNAEPFGPKPRCLLTLGADGRFSTVIVRSGQPRFASNNREKGTAQENQAVVGGSIGYFGTYKVNSVDRTLEFHIVSCTYPNWEGTDQKRSITLSGESLTWVNNNPSAGGPSGVVKWKREK